MMVMLAFLLAFVPAFTSGKLLICRISHPLRLCELLIYNPNWLG